MKINKTSPRIKPHFNNHAMAEFVSQSEKEILGFIRKKGSCMQTELTHNVALSQQSLSRIVNQLETKQMIKKGQRLLANRRGQPSTILSLNPKFSYAFGVSLMADSVAVSLMNFSGKLIDFNTPVLENLTRDTVLAAVSVCIEQMLRKAELCREDILGVGVATSGFRINKEAVFNPPSSLDDFALIDLELLFSEHLHLPVWVENDGKAAAIAENMLGIGRTINNFAYFYIATGFGGGIISEGSIFTGSRGNAGEFSSILPMTGYTTPNLETLRVIINSHGENIGSVSELIEHYDDNWTGIEEWLVTVSAAISLICSATSAILDTQAIVLGGRLPNALAYRLIPHIEFFTKQRRSIEREHAQIYVAQCESEVTTTGAAHLPFIHCFFDY